MRAIVVAVVAIGFSGSAIGQTRGTDAMVPQVIGNRANGFSYQPRPSEVYPREVAAGVRPSPAAQTATDHALAELATELLRSEGKDVSSVPDFTRVRTGEASGVPASR
jgi:hypothetical protein